MGNTIILCLHDRTAISIGADIVLLCLSHSVFPRDEFLGELSPCVPHRVGSSAVV